MSDMKKRTFTFRCQIDDDPEERIKKWNEHKKLWKQIREMAPCKEEAITEESLRNYLRERENRYRVLVLHENEHSLNPEASY